MHTVINIPAESYKRLEAQARQAGTTPEELTLELLETVLHAREKSQPRTAHEILQAAGHVRPLTSKDYRPALSRPLGI